MDSKGAKNHCRYYHDAYDSNAEGPVDKFVCVESSHSCKHWIYHQEGAPHLCMYLGYNDSCNSYDAKREALMAVLKNANDKLVSLESESLVDKVNREMEEVADKCNAKLSSFKGVFLEFLSKRALMGIIVSLNTMLANKSMTTYNEKVG